MGTPFLELRDVSAGYGKALALRDCSLQVQAGEIVALLGPNGAGKTTALRAASGLLRTHRGAVIGGEVRIAGKPMTGQPAEAFVASGVAHCLEGRRLFPTLTVEENLRLGAAAGRSRPQLVDGELRALFPVLETRRRELAGLLSGGEQQMVAIARALASRPSLLLLDEPTLGLSPMLVDQVMDLISRLRAAGTTVLLVEQHAARALEMADRSYVVEAGRVRDAGPPVRAGADITSAYFGSDATDVATDPRRRAPWL